MIAHSVARSYQKLTGKKATIVKNHYSSSKNITGPYVDLLGDVFKILQIKGNIEHYAKDAIESQKMSVTRKP